MSTSNKKFTILDISTLWQVYDFNAVNIALVASHFENHEENELKRKLRY
jgi:hypothetical protein